MYTEVRQVFSSKKGVPPFILHQPQFYEIQLLSVPPPIVIGFAFHLRSLHSKHSNIFNLGFSKESTICFHHFRGRDLPKLVTKTFGNGHIRVVGPTFPPFEILTNSSPRPRGISPEQAGKPTIFCSMVFTQKKWDFPWLFLVYPEGIPSEKKLGDSIYSCRECGGVITGLFFNL